MQFETIPPLSIFSTDSCPIFAGILFDILRCMCDLIIYASASILVKLHVYSYPGGVHHCEPPVSRPKTLAPNLKPGILDLKHHKPKNTLTVVGQGPSLFA